MLAITEGVQPARIVQPKSGSWTERSVWFLGCRARRNDAEWCDREDTLFAVNAIF